MGKNAKAYLALIFICIVWGTTYLAIRVGVMHYPAFLYAGIRQVISGAIIMAFGLMLNKKADLSWKSLRHQMFIGFLLITVGNGLVTWAEKYVPSGVAALICAMMPVVAVLINVGTNKNERVNASIILGLLLGIGGIALIFKDNIKDLANPSYLLGIICLFTATSSWAVGSVLNRRLQNPVNAIFNSGMQLGWGGVFLLIGSPFIDDLSHPFIWHTDAILALAYLIVFGSVLAYTAYMYALRTLPVGLVTTYAYVNPLVAVVLGYLWLGEQLTWFTALAFLTIMLGVYIVNRGYKQQKTAAMKKDFGNNAISALQVEETA
jgi:drug/metabolite transporter (DMT)-like permease